MEIEKKQQKRGRKPRGGISNLNEIIQCQTSINTSMQMQTQQHDDHFSSIDLPWKNVQAPPITKKTEISDDELDNMDLFQQEEHVSFEQIFKTQTNSSIHQKNLPIIITSSNETNLLNIPEHLRIVDIPNSFVVPTSTSTSTSASVSTSTPTSAPISTSSSIYQDPQTQYFHSLRLLNYSKENIRQSQNIHFDDNFSWPERSQFACWFCCHTFDEYPKVIPINLTNQQGKKIYHVIGNCCSWNCVKSYVLREFNNFSLLNTFFYDLFGESIENIKIAPSPVCLQYFGGTMTIQEYRQSFYNPKQRVSHDVLQKIQILVAKSFIFDSKKMN